MTSGESSSAFFSKSRPTRLSPRLGRDPSATKLEVEISGPRLSPSSHCVPEDDQLSSATAMRMGFEQMLIFTRGALNIVYSAHAAHQPLGNDECDRPLQQNSSFLHDHDSRRYCHAYPYRRDTLRSAVPLRRFPTCFKTYKRTVIRSLVRPPATNVSAPKKRFAIGVPVSASHRHRIPYGSAMLPIARLERHCRQR